MADNSVFITGAADGAFTEALSGLPPWATEKTLLEIKKLLGGGAGGGSKMSDFDRLLDKLKRRDKAEEDRANKRKKEDEEKDLREKKFGKTLSTTNEKFDYATQALQRFSDAVMTAQRDNFDVFAKLQESGVSVRTGFEDASTGFEALTQMTNLAGIKMKDLSETLVKYNTAVNIYSLGKFTKTLGMARQGLQDFGFNSKESAELLGSYLEAQMGFSDITAKSVRETSDDLQVFGKRINSLALATGQARSAILANLEAVSKSTDATVLAGQIGKDAAMATNEFLASIKDQNIRAQMSKMMTDAIKPLNQTFQSFQKIGMGGFGQKLMTFTNSLKGLNPEEARKRQSEWVKANQAEMERYTQQANFYSQIPEMSGYATEALNSIVAMQQTARQYEEQQSKENDPAVKARARFSAAFTELSSKFEVFFGKVLTPIINVLAGGIEILNDFFTFLGDIPGMTTLTSAIGTLTVGVTSLWTAFKAVNTFLSLFGKTVWGIISGPLRIVSMVFRGIATAAGFVWEGLLALLNPISKLVAAFAVGFGIGTVLQKMLSQFEWFNDMTDTIFAGLDHILQYIPGLSADAKDRIATRQKNAEISVPKTPKSSTIDSPSADKNKKAENAQQSTQAQQGNTPVGPGLDKPPAGSDINNTLAYQGSLSEQMLLALNKLVSTNSDILRYTRTQA